MKTPMESLGICLGASTVAMVRLRRAEAASGVVWARKRVHDGNPRRVLQEMLASVDALGMLRVAATGRKFRRYLELSTISEPEAVERAV
ncbi:MAG TPA: hypothetical protein PLM14_17025, partial [Candidatus Hydrogenedentes bacterium]|nr:hypothetical protein [Candidatus Hydrogenedentota bacterium]